jgi:cellulose synthase/poly-beta-1,6-N-acetylglucosamine synthase-like glycosyltransferase
LGYALILFFYRLGWRRLKPWEKPGEENRPAGISVVIPARNEALRIGECLAAIEAGGYPPGWVEVIVVDDHSEDLTAEVARQMGARVISLADYVEQGGLNSYKKKALEVGIEAARGEWIVTTDADCVAGPEWLNLIGGASRALCGPVLFHRERNLLQRFQSLDMLGMMGVTGAGMYWGVLRMGNGANLCFPKAVFQTVGGYSGTEARASGDDLFLLQKIGDRYTGGIQFMKNRDAAVYTEAMPDWASFVRQRIRWGTKNAALPDWRIKGVLGMVFLFCWMILGAFAAALISGSGQMWMLALFLLSVKALADYIFLREMCLYFGRKDLLRYFWPSFFLHVWYIAWVGLLSLVVRRYEWKGRKVS